MISAATHLFAFAMGIIVCRAYSLRQITKIRRDDLSFRMAPVVTHSVEDAARRTGA